MRRGSVWIISVRPNGSQADITAMFKAHDIVTAVEIGTSKVCVLIGTTDDHGRAVLFLVAPASAWVTGQVIAVDGGLSA